MKKSFYNITYSFDKGYLLFNSLTNSLVILDAEGMEKYDNDGFEKEELERLFKSGFYVEEDIDEVRYVEYKYLKSVFNNTTPMFRVLTTTACNAKCSYCYETGTSISTMTTDTADHLTDFIIKETQNSKYFSIRWFGGEPLLNWKIIDYISEGLNRKCKAEHIGYITTNGSLWTDELVSRAKDSWNIKHVQISLDGYRDLHNQIKKYQDRKDGFTDTINNIHKLLDNDIRVDIRLNVTKSNAQSMPGLIDYLAENFRDNSFLNVYAYPVFDSDVDKICRTQSEDVIRNSDLNEYFIPIQEHIESSGWKDNKKSRQKTVSCGAIKNGNYVMNPNGDIFKCTFETKDPSKSIGNVRSGIKRNATFLRWSVPKYSEKCYKCKFLPICQGSCKYQVIHNGVTDCRYTDDTLRQSLISQVNNNNK